MSFFKNLAFIFALMFCELSLASSFMGINTNEITNFDTNPRFVNFFKVSEPFSENREFTRGPVQYDRNGWPKNLNGGQAGARLFKWMDYSIIPEGNYIVRYEGIGTIEYKGDVIVVSRAQGRDIIRFPNKGKVGLISSLVITHTDPHNYIRNISVTPPGGICQNNPYRVAYSQNNCSGSKYLPFENYHKHIIFNPSYLSFMRPFKTIRFMNMSGLTENPISEWSKRPKVSSATWGGSRLKRGAPIEIMVKLANLLKADAWFNIPHAANNTYVTNYANLVQGSLRGKAYIEYTNEAWNTHFAQSHYVRKEGQKIKLGPNIFWAGIKFYSKRSKEIFKIWKQAYKARPTSLKTVLSGWAENTQITTTLLESFNVYKDTDVFAVAPYFYAEQHEIVNSRSPNDLFSLMNNPNKKRSIPTILGHLKIHGEITRKFGVGLVAYEGGQHLVYEKKLSKSVHPNPLIRQTNLDERMEKAFIKLIDGFKNIGGSLFMSFSAPRACSGHSGCMGILEHVDDTPNKSPKYRALRRYF